MCFTIISFIADDCMDHISQFFIVTLVLISYSFHLKIPHLRWKRQNRIYYYPITSVNRGYASAIRNFRRAKSDRKYRAVNTRRKVRIQGSHFRERFLRKWISIFGGLHARFPENQFWKHLLRNGTVADARPARSLTHGARRFHSISFGLGDE